MIAKEINDKVEYTQYLLQTQQTQFLQSWEWGEFLKSEGKKVFRMGFYDNDDLFFVVSLFENSLPLGFSYLSAPRIELKSLSSKQLEFVFDEIFRLAQKEKALFLRFEPKLELQTEDLKYKLVKTIDVQPSQTLLLDLLKGEEELLKEMHQKTRYNVRLAKRKGVLIRESDCSDYDFEKFWSLMGDTGNRDAFRLHSKEHYKKMLNMGSEALKIKLIFAEYEGQVIAANIISFFGDMVTYVHGASSNNHRNVMAPYFLQWYVIREAQKDGFKFYDFFGIDEKKWPGVTRFKKGFGGEVVCYPGTFDLVFNKYLYVCYIVLRKIRRIF